MRESGILMPVSSLPGPYGIGCFGKEAFKFVDFLADAGQKIWQLLPLSPTGYGDSPYQSCSAFAGNPYFIDLDALKEEGLLTAAQLKAEPWGDDPKQVDYGTLYTSRYKVLRTAYAAWRKACKGLHGCSDYFPDDYYAFTLSNEAWLEDYALYMALKVANGMKNWVEWERPYRLRDKAALAAFAAENEEEIGFWKFVQYKFSTQWQAVKQYANDKGVQILGDIPIYVSADSVDAWVGGKLFELDAEGRFARVAGCPPDYFSADGQLWGNPLYNWTYHKQTGYAWWVQRVRHALGIYDLLRIDHFRGFDTYWAIPADSATAKTGKWENGPGMELFDALEQALGQLPIIAEDLGELFPSVRKLLADSTFPGMKVLQFAFSGGDNEYLPHNRQYLERVFGAKLEQWARQGRSAAVALVALDKGPQLCDTYGQPVMDQLHCFVGNQWKKHYDTPMHQVVCRLTGSVFVVGSVDTTGPQLAARMQELYEQMPHECITTTGMMHRVQFTMSGAAAGLDEVEAKNWPALYELCDARLRKVQASGGDRIGCAE